MDHPEHTWHCRTCPYATSYEDGARGHVEYLSTHPRGWLGHGEAHVLDGPPLGVASDVPTCGPTATYGRDGRMMCACGVITNPAGYCCETGTAVDAAPDTIGRRCVACGTPEGHGLGSCSLGGRHTYPAAPDRFHDMLAQHPDHRAVCVTCAAADEYRITSPDGTVRRGSAREYGR